MALREVKLPLYEGLFYNYTTSLEQDTFYLEFQYVKRIKDWLFTLKSANRTTLVRGQRLTPNTLLFADYQLPGLSGFFLLIPKSGEDPVKFEDRRERLSEYFNFYYYYDNGEPE